MEKKLTYTVKEAAQVVGLDKMAIYDLCNAEGDFPHLRIGKRIIIPRQAFEEWLHSKATSKARA